MQAQITRASHTTTPTTLLHYVPILGLLALVIALALIGIVQATTTIKAIIQHGRVFAIGQPIVISFGALTAVQVEKVDGLTAHDLAGMTHGIQNLVLSDKVQIQLSVQLVNRTADAVAYAPEQFKLISADDQAGVDPVSGTLQSGLLPAYATINGEVDFVAPRTNQPLWITYHDAGSNQVLRIAIGPADPNAGPIPIPAEQGHTQEN